MRSENELRHRIDLARCEVNRQNAPLALEYLNEMRAEIENYSGTPIWAEHQLTYAEAVSTTDDPVVRSEGIHEFEEAIRRISNLAERAPELELRAHEHFGKFLAGCRRRSTARNHYEIAKRVAVELGLKDETARIQLEITKNDLECDQSPELPSFQTFKKVAKELGSTPQQQLQAWINHTSQSEEMSHVLVAARNKGRAASVEYFRGLLKSMK